MANNFVVTSKVMDTLLDEFVVSMGILDSANTTPTTEFTSGSKFGIGGSVQIYKQPRFEVNEIDLTQTNDLSDPVQPVQQETETLEITRLFSATMELTEVERALNMRDKDAQMIYFYYPIIRTLKKKVSNFFYQQAVNEAYLTAGSPSASISSVQDIANASVVMDELQMPVDRSLILSSRDAANLRVALGSYYDSTVSRSALRGQLPATDSFHNIFSDDTVRVVKSGTASANNALSLSVQANNGDTQLGVAGLVIGQTIRVGAKIQLNVASGDDIFALSPIDKSEVSIGTYKPTYIVAEGDASIPQYDANTKTYTADATQMFVKIKNPVRTLVGDQYQNVNAPSATLPETLSIRVLGDHKVNMAMCRGCLSAVAPPMNQLKNGAVSVMSTFNGLSMTAAIQSDLDTWSNRFRFTMQLGAKIHPEYIVSLMSTP